MKDEIPPEWLTQCYALQESLLESVNISRIGVVEIMVSISDMNLSIHHPNHPTTSAKLFEDLYPEGLLRLNLKDVVSLNLDRLAVHRDRFFENLGDSSLDHDPVAQEGPKTIVGVELHRDSSLLDRLGDHKPEFRHLSIGTMDSSVDVVFRRLSLSPNALR